MPPRSPSAPPVASPDDVQRTDLEAWGTQWVARLVAIGQRQLAVPRLIQGPQQAVVLAEARALQGECDRPERWTEIWRQVRTTSGTSQESLLAWLGYRLTRLPTHPPAGSVAGMVEGVRTLCDCIRTEASVRTHTLQGGVLARWIRAFQPGGESTPEGTPARSGPPALTWECVPPAERAALLDALFALKNTGVREAVLEAFPAEDLGLDRHWARVIEAVRSEHQPPHELLPYRGEDPRLDRWWGAMATNSKTSVLRILLRRTDWPDDALPKLATPGQGESLLGLVRGVKTPPTAFLLDLLADEDRLRQEDWRTLLRLGRGPADAPALDPALTDAMGQLLNRWVRTLPAPVRLNAVMNEALIAWYFAQPGVAAHLDAASRRRILLDAPAAVKVALVGAMADDMRMNTGRLGQEQRPGEGKADRPRSR